MIRVSIIPDVESFYVVDKNNIRRKLKIYSKKGNVYIGPVQSLFNRNFVYKDKYRLDFASKLDGHLNELLHVQTLFEKIEQQTTYSNFTVDMIKDILYDKGYTDDDFYMKDKIYTCAKENFIEFGFNTMNFCLDRKGDIWVHYKEYEEQKQYREIVSNLNKSAIKSFEKDYRKMNRFVRYVNTDDLNDIKCFSLRSINITKLYHWLSDNHLIHKVKYVSEIYNDVTRELSFTDITTENSYVKVIVTKDGIVLKNTANGLV